MDTRVKNVVSMEPHHSETHNHAQLERETGFFKQAVALVVVLLFTMTPLVFAKGGGGARGGFSGGGKGSLGVSSAARGSGASGTHYGVSRGAHSASRPVTSRPNLGCRVVRPTQCFFGHKPVHVNEYYRGGPHGQTVHVGDYYRNYPGQGSGTFRP